MIGIDLIEIERMERLLQQFGQKGLERFLLPSEIERCHSAQSAAALWAAKEAIAKALGTGIGKEVGFKDIEIIKDERGAPKVRLDPKVQEAFGIEEVAISLTHDGGFAAAAAIVVRSPSSSKA